MLVNLGDTSHDLLQRPLVVGVMPTPSDDHHLILLAKAAISAGADVVEMHDETPSQSLRGLHGADLPWGSPVSDVTRVRSLCAAGAAVLWWSGPPEALGDAQSAAGSVTVIAAVIPWGDLSSAPATPWMVDLGDEHDVASIASKVTVALELGACAIRTTAVQSARRAAYVVRAIEAAR